MQSNNNSRPNGRYVSSQGYKVVYGYKNYFLMSMFYLMGFEVIKEQVILSLIWALCKIY